MVIGISGFNFAPLAITLVWSVLPPPAAALRCRWFVETSQCQGTSTDTTKDNKTRLSLSDVSESCRGELSSCKAPSLIDLITQFIKLVLHWV